MIRQVYIAGPMTGCKDYNFPAFRAAAARLRAAGYEVVNPVEIVESLGGAIAYEASAAVRAKVHDEEAMAIASSSIFYMLRGWERSKGTKAELRAALSYGLELMLEGNEVADGQS